MANRVFDTLAQWTALDDAALDDDDRRHRRPQPDARRRAHARRLFAPALETPGGLKVQTIHAFCTRLLHQFPFEADVAARFEVLDDAHAVRAARPAALEVLLEAAAQARRARSAARSRSRSRPRPTRPSGGDRRGDRASATSWTAWIDAAGGVDGGDRRAVAARSASRPDETLEQVEAEIVDGAADLPRARWPAVAALRTADYRATRSRRRASHALRPRERAERASRATCSIFCTGELEPRKSIVTSGHSREASRRWLERLIAEQERVCALLERRRAVACARPHRRAGHHRARGDRALPRREGPARPARLRRPDRQDAGAARRGASPPGCTTSSTSASTMC